MKKLFNLLFVLCLCTALITACSEETSASADGTPPGEQEEPFIFKGVVVEAGNLLSVEMEETAYAFGLYHVITSEETLYFDKNGSPVSREAVKVGSVIEISFSGQVMMSYPPKIAAKSIKILS